MDKSERTKLNVTMTHKVTHGQIVTITYQDGAIEDFKMDDSDYDRIEVHQDQELIRVWREMIHSIDGTPRRVETCTMIPISNIKSIRVLNIMKD